MRIFTDNKPGGETDLCFRSLNLSQRLVPARLFKHSEQNLRAFDPVCTRRELESDERKPGKAEKELIMKMYLGIDMAKHDFVSAVEFEDQSLKLVHPKIKNTHRGFNQLKQWATKLASQYKVDSVHIGVESTGGYEIPLVQWFRKHLDFSISVLNPIQVKRFGQSQLIRTKTDKVDARLIAHYMAIHRPDPTPVPSQEVKALQALTRHLEHLTRKRADEVTYLQSVWDSKVKTSARQTIKSYDRQIEKIEQRIKDHFDNHPDLKANKNLLMTIPGIGEITSAILLSEMNGSLIPKQQVAHAGLAPREKQSGLFKGKTQLCKMGNKRIRTALFLPTLAAITYNPLIVPFYETLVNKGKPKKVAVCACMRKLLHIVVGVLKNQSPFNPNIERFSIAS
jgi:transposase